jgi:hypothetical protein
MPTEFPAAERHEFTVEETVQLRQAALRRSVSLNDLLARDLFLALMHWRREQQLSDQDWLRMMVPMNLRSSKDYKLPAANFVGLVFLDRRGVDSEDPDQLLASIHDEMALIKRNQLGLTFLFSLLVARWLPGGLRKQVHADRCTMSCVFTNVGKLLAYSPLPRRDGQLVVGDVQFESFQALVPVRPYNCTTFTAHQYARRLVLDLHYDPGVLTPSQARRIMELVADGTRASSSGESLKLAAGR